MTFPGRVQNGVVVFEGPMSLPEGTNVVVSSSPSSGVREPKQPKPVVLPIFDFNGPPDIDLTNGQIGEIMDQEDASS